MAEGDVLILNPDVASGVKGDTGFTKFQEDAYSLGKAAGEAAAIAVGAGAAGKLAGSAVGKIAVDIGANAAKIGMQAAGDQAGNGSSLGEGLGKLADKCGNALDKCFDIGTFRNPKVTDQERKSAKDKLAGEVSPLIAEPDAKMLGTLQDAIVNGDLSKLSDAFKSIRQNPEKMNSFIKELNRELKEHNAGLELVSTKDGRVFVCGDKDGTAIEMRPDGKVELRSIDRRMDGSIVVKPGEIVGQDPNKVMRELGDSAVRGMTRGFEHLIKSVGKPIDFGVPTRLAKVADDK